MALSTRKKIITAKIESIYGTDPLPTGANAMQVRNLNVQPLNAETVNRDLIRPYFGNSDTLLAQAFSQLDFEVELQASGIPGVAPAWADLLKACAYAEDKNTSAISIVRVGNVATATLNAHGFSFGSKVRISGAAQPEYNGDFVITDVTANTFDFEVAGTPASPATGTPVVGTSVVYSPISEDLPSVTIKYNIDGVLHSITGARGSAEFTLSVKQIPIVKFTFQGVYNDPSDTAAVVPDFSKFQIPRVVNTSNTPAFSLFGYSAPLESMSLNLANDVQYRTLVGFEAVNILDRKPAGTFVLEAPKMAQMDFFTLAKAATVGAMSITHGIASGLIVKLDAPRVSLQAPAYQDSQGVQMLSIPFVASPELGNDDLTITFK